MSEVLFAVNLIALIGIGVMTVLHMYASKRYRKAYHQLESIEDDYKELLEIVRLTNRVLVEKNKIDELLLRHKLKSFIDKARHTQERRSQN